MTLNARTLCLAVLVACAPSQPEIRSTSSPSGATGIDLAGMDRSVAPGDDFYGYANGGWIKTHEIPPDRASYGTGAMVQESTAKRVADLIAEAARDAAPGSDARKIGDYYASYLDEAAIAARGLAPLEPALERITGISDPRTLARALGAALRADVDVLNNTNYDTDNLFGLWVAQDLSDPSRYSAFLLQGGLGMPDRDYYLDASPRMAEIRDKYRAHVAAVFRHAGITDAGDADARAARVFDLEHKIAEAHRPRIETEDVKKGNNHWTRAERTEQSPSMAGRGPRH
jgi:putative endopeptidase